MADIVAGFALPDQDSELLAELRAGSEQAFASLLATFERPIYNFLCRLLEDPEDAPDVTQEVFLKVFRNISGFKGEATLKTWIFKIAFSEILNRLRWWKRRYRFATVSLDDNGNENGNGFHVADKGPTPEQILHSKERENAIQQALEKLSSDHRSIIVLRDVEGFSYNEIADVLGVSVGTVKSRLARARADLKKSLMRYLSVHRV